MEQKQTLWIIAAAGIFLLVVIGAALILYSPAMQTEPEVTAVQIPAAASTPETYQINSAAAQSAEPNSGAQTPVPAKDVTVITDTTTVVGTGQTNIDLNAFKSAAAQSPQPAVQPQNETARRSAQSDSTVVAITQRVQPEPAPAQPAPAPQPAAEPRKPEIAQPVPASAAPPAPAAQFWVQVASLTSKHNAEAARKALEDNKIPSEIFTHTDESGKTFYRVRVGPYTTKNEAEYWRTRIAMIDTFSGTSSYITESKAAR